MGTPRSAGWGALSAAALLSAAAGCVTPESVTPVTHRWRFNDLRRQVAGTPVGVLQLVAERGSPSHADAAAERSVDLDPDIRARERLLVDAIGALGLFTRVGSDAPAATGSLPAYRLLVTTERADAEWVGMTGYAWANFLLWGVFGPGAWLVADETFAGNVEWGVRLVALDGDEVASTRLTARSEVNLNDFDRGFSLWDLLVFGAAPIDAHRLRVAGTKVLWFAEADAALGCCEWLADQAQELRRRAIAPEPVPVPVPEIERPPVEPVPPPPAPPPAPAAPRWRVLCLGVERYADDPPAPGAAADARALAEALRGRLADRDATVTVLTDADATSAAAEAWLAERAGEALGETDHVWISFAGRGTTDARGDPYCVLHDGRAAAPGDGALPLRDLARRLRRAGDVTVVLDCAFQGRVDERGPDSDRPPMAASRLFPGGVRALAASWAEGEATQAEDGHGVFTRVLLDALAGAADADGDGRVTLAEAATYTEPRARALARAAGVDERPARLSGPPASELFPVN